jgi:hypothetical protein
VASKPTGLGRGTSALFCNTEPSHFALLAEPVGLPSTSTVMLASAPPVQVKAKLMAMTPAGVPASVLLNCGRSLPDPPPCVSASGRPWSRIACASDPAVAGVLELDADWGEECLVRAQSNWADLRSACPGVAKSVVSCFVHQTELSMSSRLSGHGDCGSAKGQSPDLLRES